MLMHEIPVGLLSVNIRACLKETYPFSAWRYSPNFTMELVSNCFFFRAPGTFLNRTAKVTLPLSSSCSHLDDQGNAVSDEVVRPEGSHRPCYAQFHYSKQKKRRKSVGFDRIYMRFYSIEIGDSLNCSIGCPITLGWDYSEEQVGIDDYEASRNRRRNREDLRLPSEERRQLLSDSNFSEWDILRAERNLILERRRLRRAKISYRFITS